MVGGVCELPTKFSKSEGLTGSQFSVGVAEKMGMTFFRDGVAVFT